MTTDMGGLRFESAQSAIGESFSVSLSENGPEVVQMRLSEVTPAGTSHAFRAHPFSVIFEGPTCTPFDQGTYFFTNPKVATQPIFIVPIGQSADLRQYQAIFN